MPGASDAKKGKGDLIAIAFGAPKPKPKPAPEPLEDDDDVSLDAHGAAFASLADALGIPAEKRSRAQAALKQFVKSCTESGYEEE